ncbi:MAG: hypothetical protein H5T76_38650, partial [Streptomyces sp.]|nr:hypothetical protein [Streptomyces sp.]
MPEPRDRVAADEPRSPWLRGGFVLAAAFVGFVTVIGAALAVGSDTPGEDDAAATPPRSPETRTSAPAADGGDCPELTDRARDIPAAAPADVTWT